MLRSSKDWLGKQQAIRDSVQAQQERARSELEELAEMAAPRPRAWTPELVDKFLTLYDEQDSILVAAGFPPTSRWWRCEIEKFFRSGARRWVSRVGRRGGKSSTFMRLLVCWVRSKMWTVSPGTVAIIPILSLKKGEAKDRLPMLEAILGGLGLEKKTGTRGLGPNDFRVVRSGNDAVVSIGKWFEFRVFASSEVNVGSTAIATFSDELAYWESRETHMNPAKTVLALLRPATASQPLAFDIMTSAPWGENDYHAELYDQGTTPHQFVSFAETWVANDGFISEEETRRIESDPDLWSIAYAAKPGSTSANAFDRALVESAFRNEPAGEFGSRGWVALDSSQGGDDFAYASGRVTSARELVVTDVSGWEGADVPPTNDIAAVVSGVAAAMGAGTVYGDKYEAKGVGDALAENSTAFDPISWTNESKHSAVTHLRRLLREGRFVVTAKPSQKGEPENFARKLKQQMLDLKRELSSGGKTFYATRGLDELSCIITAMHAVNDGKIPLSNVGSIDWSMVERMKGEAPEFVAI